VPENHCADWASDKADSIDGKRLQHTDQRVGLGKEEFAENQASDDAVEQEIVPLDRRADRARDYGLAQFNAVLESDKGPDRTSVTAMALLP
jgi:hypothetical protein